MSRHMPFMALANDGSRLPSSGTRRFVDPVNAEKHAAAGFEAVWRIVN